MLKKLFLAVFLSITGFIASIQASDISAEKQKDIQKLIQLTVLRGLAKDSLPVELRRFELPINKVDIVAMRENSAQIENEATKIMMEIMLSPYGVIDQLIPLYDKHFDHPTIKGLINFIQSQHKKPLSPDAIDIMLKVVQADPELAEESRKISNEWTTNNANRIRLKISRGLIAFGALPITSKLAKCALGKHDSSHYTSRQVDIQPKIIGSVQPAYPSYAEKDHTSGSVLLQIKIDEYGLVENISIINSTPHGVFDQSAIDAFSAAMIIPACKNGFTVPSITNVNVQYEYAPSESALPN